MTELWPERVFELQFKLLPAGLFHNIIKVSYNIGIDLNNR